MGLLPNLSYAREALLPMSIRPNVIWHIYVPFVDHTEVGHVGVDDTRVF